MTITATGLPGSPNSTASPMRPKAIGRPGLIASFQNATSPMRFIISRMKSASPTDTPPLVMITSAA